MEEFKNNPSLKTGAIVTIDAVATFAPGLGATAIKKAGKWVVRGGKAIFIAADGQIYKATGKGAAEFISQISKTKIAKKGISVVDDVTKSIVKYTDNLKKKAGGIGNKIAKGWENITSSFNPKKVVSGIENAKTTVKVEVGNVGAKIMTENAAKLKVPNNLKNEIADVIVNGDKSGLKTEKIVNKIFGNDPNLEVISGGKYGKNNGFDHVIRNKKTGEVFIIDSKQITNAKTLDVGSIQLPKAAKEQRQLSPKWIDEVLEKLPPDSPAKRTIQKAIKDQKLRTGLTGINKKTGEVMFIKVNVQDIR